jgi:alanine dehydrogenase
MFIGCPKEIKNNENRVGLTPNAVRSYVEAGHAVVLEAGAGLGSAIDDQAYREAGAQLATTAAEVWGQADMIVKVKEPLESEYALMRDGQLIYTYFHFAANEPLTKACLDRRIVALAYETVQEGRALPLLRPMSEVAGRMSILMGSYFLAKTQGGRGLLPMGATGVAPAEVLVLGGGVVGFNAARVAAGLGAAVTILDVDLDRLEFLGRQLPPNVTPLFSDPLVLESKLRTADIVVGAVLVPGAMAPKLVRRSHLKLLQPGAVVVDVAIDQGGCFETSKPTTHSAPVYVVDDVIHYCVANMPGAYARTSTYALSSATIKYGLELANLGVEKACCKREPLKLGLNMYKGTITCQGVADAFGLGKLYSPAEKILA